MHTSAAETVLFQNIDVPLRPFVYFSYFLCYGSLSVNNFRAHLCGGLLTFVFYNLFVFVLVLAKNFRASLCGGWRVDNINWEHLGVSGSIWEHLEASGSIWEHLGASGSIWEHLGASGSICEHLGASGSIWEHFRCPKVSKKLKRNCTLGKNRES